MSDTRIHDIAAARAAAAVEHINRSARLQPANNDHPEPFIDVGGAQVYAGFDQALGGLRVDIWTEEVRRPFVRWDDTVPVVVEMHGAQVWTDKRERCKPEPIGVVEGPQRALHMVHHRLLADLDMFDRTDSPETAATLAERIATDTRELLDRLHLRTASAADVNEDSEWIAATLHEVDVAGYRRGNATKIHVDASAEPEQVGALIAEIGDNGERLYDPQDHHPIDAGDEDGDRTGRVVLVSGIARQFTGDDLDCLARTAGEAVHGDGVDELSGRQIIVAKRAYDAHMADCGAPVDDEPGGDAAEPDEPAGDEWRMRLEREPSPEQPYDDGSSPLLRLDPTGAGWRAEHIAGISSFVPEHIDRIVEAAERWGRDHERFERYMRINHGTTEVQWWDARPYASDYVYVTFDTAGWREHLGIAPEQTGVVDMAEWRAYCEGDVWFYVIERRRTWKPADGGDGAMTTWEHVESIGGFYGEQYAQEAAQEALDGHRNG